MCLDMTTVVVLCWGSGDVGGAGSRAMLSTAWTISNTYRMRINRVRIRILHFRLLY